MTLNVINYYKLVADELPLVASLAVEAPSDGHPATLSASHFFVETPCTKLSLFNDQLSSK